jgi:probable phosphoglycerate mutase
VSRGATTILLVRHALCDPIGRSLAGRRAGVPLNAEGRAQARALATRLDATSLSAIYSSPLERAMETATEIGRARGLAPVTIESLTELEVGEWTGATFDELRDDERWRAFNAYRSGTRPPEGELAAEVQARVVVALEQLADRHGEETIAVVSHADVIRTAIAYFIGVPIDLARRLEIDPASVSVLELAPWGPRLLALNALARL